MPDSRLSVVIPAYDCAATVGAVVAGACAVAGDVVVVSDGSRDETAARAGAAGARVEIQERNRGKGFALRRGLELALERDPDWVALLDADGQHDPEDLPALLAAARREEYDMVIGCRLQDPERIPPARYWTNYIGTRILTWMTGFELEDSQSGFRLLSAGLARRLALRSDGYAVETEMLIRAAKLGTRLGHVRVRTIYNDETSHFRPLADTLRIALAAIQFKIEDT
ncbi:MAG: glycosyltransferase family 2 protein [Thermoanaerobaculia bacterium]